MTTEAPKRPLITQWPVERHAGTTWPPGGPLYHCHRREREADAFNDGPRVKVRFSPIWRPAPLARPPNPDDDRSTEVVPVWYGGTTTECAVAESLFHDIPVATGGVVPRSKSQGRLVTAVRPTRPLRLLRLDVDGLRGAALDLFVTESEADRYSDTESVAQDLYSQHPDVDGLVWMSERRSVDAAVVLYAAGGDGGHTGGIRSGDLRVDPAPVRDFDTYDEWKWLHDYAATLRVDVYFT